MKVTEKYNIALTVGEFDLLIRLIDDEELTDEEEDQLRGVRKKLKHKQRQLIQRRRYEQQRI